jgi:hypothetical protein
MDGGVRGIRHKLRATLPGGAIDPLQWFRASGRRGPRGKTNAIIDASATVDRLAGCVADPSVAAINGAREGFSGPLHRDDRCPSTGVVLVRRQVRAV